MHADWFNAEYWRTNNAITGTSTGRHTTWFIKPPSEIGGSDWVLRHYYRGGLIAKITRDKFVYVGLKRTRGFLEVKLLDYMQQMGLPVPAVIGARIQRHGLFYRADLLMEKIEAKDLVAKLSLSKLSKEIWHSIGKTIALFHQKGIYHADLNAHNLLIDDANKVWLIDFDRCEKRPIQDAWQQNNIERLHRSFIKEKGLISNFNFDDESWKYLLEGYRS